MKCLLKYQWLKLPREELLSHRKGIMGHWAKLASRAAFRNGYAKYCGYRNKVTAGAWAGGIVGVKSILGVKSRTQALEVLDQLSELGYITYRLDPKTKKLTYKIDDWVIKCSGAGCNTGTVYATTGYGFLCLPRNITERLVKKDINLMKRTRGWIYGAIPSIRIPATHFHIWRRLFNWDSTVLL